jgi:hypothetical protein
MLRNTSILRTTIASFPFFVIVLLGACNSEPTYYCDKCGEYLTMKDIPIDVPPGPAQVDTCSLEVFLYDKGLAYFGGDTVLLIPHGENGELNAFLDTAECRKLTIWITNETTSEFMSAALNLCLEHSFGAELVTRP